MATKLSTSNDDAMQATGATPLTRLLEHLELERVEKFLFLGQSIDPGWGRLYGGHVLATVSEMTAPLPSVTMVLVSRNTAPFMY